MDCDDDDPSFKKNSFYNTGQNLKNIVLFKVITWKMEKISLILSSYFFHIFFLKI